MTATLGAPAPGDANAHVPNADNPDHRDFATGRPIPGAPQEAVPGWVVDLARDGIDPAEFKNEPRDLVVSRALFKTALFAQFSNQTEAEWLSAVDRTVTHALARQVHTDRRGRELHQLAVRKKYAKVWKDAWRWRLTRPAPWTREEAAEQVARLADEVIALIDADVDLADNAKQVVRHAAEVAAARGSQKITLADAAFVTGTGLGLSAWRTAIRKAITAGYLAVYRRGEKRGKGRRPQATIYVLSVPNLPGTGASSAGETSSDAPRSVPSASSSAPKVFSPDYILQVLGVDALAALDGATQ